MVCSKRLISSIIFNEEVKSFIRSKEEFTKMLTLNYRSNDKKNLNDYENRWGKRSHKPMLYLRITYICGPVRLENIMYFMRYLQWGNIVFRPKTKNRLNPDWECKDFVYEVKTKKHYSNSSSGEKNTGSTTQIC